MAGDAPDVRDQRRELMRRRVVEQGLGKQGLAERGPAGVAAPEPAVLRAGEHYPLSAGQRRMWFQQTLDGADTTLNVGVGYRLTGPVDPARLRRAFDDVVARHHILRTRYGVDETGEPYQLFDGEAKTPWQQHDSTGSDPTALIDAEFGRPFDLTAEPPLRVSLIRTGAEQFLLTLVVHHICWDDDCWAVFFAELSRAYRGETVSEPGTGPAPQYLAALDRIAVPTPADVAHWRAALHPLPEPVRLPGHAGEPANRRAAHHSRPLPAELFATVEAFARTHATSPFTVLLAAFGALIGRYTETRDLLVAVPVTDRPAGAEQTLGYFGNTLLLRLTGSARTTFASSVAAARETFLTGFAHACVGIDRVVSELNPTRAPGRAALDDLVQLGFSMRKDAGGFVFDGGAVEQLDLGAATAPVPLALAIVTDSRGVTVELEYQADVLDGALVERLTEHYLRLLDHALREPDRPLAALDMLGADERTAILAASHGLPAEFTGGTMIAALEATAAARPDATALAGDDIELTYAELHRRSNRLARRLIGDGVGPEDVVGLRLAGSVEFVVAMLAVLKAGAAYLPIDPGYPAERIDYLIADTAPVLILDPAWFDAAERAATELSDAPVRDADRLRPLRPDNLAYVIYTSGSTGTPKGVAVSHAAIAEHIETFAADWTMTAENRLLQAASVSFDASAAEIFLTLALGATLVIPKPGALSDVDYLVGLLERHRVTVLQMVPSVLGTLLQLPDHPVWQRLRHLPVGGEALPGPVADEFTARYPAVELRNHYGPTEAVVCATHQPVDRRYGTAVVPIGVPNRNVDGYVLDAALQLVPTGVVGELYLGGTQLARGYLRRPGQTAQRLVADPFHPGRRLYRTGDLVRRNDTGELEFIGRADEQVKIRGFRVELGEIEAVIGAHPAVRDCRVVVDTTGEPTLVAYLVPSEPATDIAAVRAHAAAQLPGYMVPGAFAVLDELPLTVTGKLDRRALPTVTAAPAGGYRKPVTPTEKRVCGIFAGLFDRAEVGADDSFFTLGGHSLLAARLVAQLRAEFGVELAIRTVFDTPTPAGLAAGLVEQFRTEFDVDLDDLGDSDDTDASGPVDTPRPVLSPAARPERIPLSYSQLVGWFQYRIEGDREAFAMPLTLRIAGPLDVDALSAALDDVVARHEGLRSTFGEHDGVPYQRVHLRQPLPLRVRPIDAAGVDEAVAELRRQPLDPRTGPLLRAELLRVDPVTHTLAVIVHHLVCDHGSLQVIVDDLIAAYGARLTGHDPQLPTLPLQFADYAIWQRSAFDTPDPWGLAELDSRRAALAGLPDEVTIPPDRPRRAVLGQRGEIAEFTVAAAERAALVALAEAAGATEFMVYQAISAVWLHTLGAGTDIVIGSPAAARVEPGTESLVGLLANAVVLRTDLSGDPTLREVLTRSRDTVLDAFTHQEVPIERLVDAVKPARSGFRNPLYQTMIHFRGRDWSAEPRQLAPGATLTGVPAEFTASLMDIDLGMTVTTAGELSVRVVANADLYDPATVTHLADALRTAFSAFAAAPAQPVSNLRLLPEDVLARVLAEPTPATPAAFSSVDSTAAEGLLIGLLEELLETTDIDGDDNFFAVGGDSITSIKWAAAAAAHGITMTPAMVFEHATIRELAAAVAGAGSTAADRSYAPMSVSGLDKDALSQLTAAWGGGQ